MSPDDHLAVFIESFIHRSCRGRYRIKPDDVIETFSHTLIDQLDPRFATPIKPPVRVDTLLRIIHSLSKATEGCYLANVAGPDDGVYPLATAIGYAEDDGAAIVSIEPGELVYYKSEPEPKADRYLLIHNPSRKAAAEQALASLKA